ncbi:putative major capsid protein L1 [Four-toed hedgehog papillomavirus]|nr:putative major capsid protein L1 [Four-toed hedgehog papillomavirus]
MAVWLPAQNKFFLPPQPVTKVLSTDEYVRRTDIFYHASSDRLLTVGNPYFEVKKNDKVSIPKVSPHQYRVFRIKLPDPNKFAFNDKSIYDADKERLVWGLRGLEIARGQPIGVAASGNPLFNKLDDVENPNKYSSPAAKDNRQNLAFDAKQTQVFIVGCTPAEGEHWTVAKRCNGVGYAADDCPPIQLLNTKIEDGDMLDIGFGAIDYGTLQQNRSEAPIEVLDTVSKYPDYIKMSKDKYGNSMFFYSRREQMYGRHLWNKAGTIGEALPDKLLVLGADGTPQKTPASYNYTVSPSGSLVSSDSQVFNRPYWLQRSQGQNNGILWGNQLFLTVGDNTRATNFNLNFSATKQETYEASKYSQYMRHTEEFDLSFIFQLCKVSLTPENLALIHTMDPDIIEGWNLSVTTPPQTLEEHYRYITSDATKCPKNVPSTEKTDPYGHLNFWNVDLSEEMSDQLDQFALGRKFLFQAGLSSSRKRPAKRVVTTTHRAKRKKKA